MGLKESSSNSGSSKSINLRYNSVVGAILISEDKTSNAIKAITAKVGADEMKKGYSTAPGSQTAIAKQMLAEADVKTYEHISGTLVSAYAKVEKNEKGDEYTYVKVHLKDEIGTSFRLSMPIENAATQMIARKLLNAEPGKEIIVAPFATYLQREGNDRPYADHGASVKQNGEEVPAGYVAEFHDARVNTGPALIAAGIADKKTIAAAINGKIIALTFKAMEETSERFKQYYEARATTQAQPAAAEAAGEKDVPEMADPDAKKRSYDENLVF